MTETTSGAGSRPWGVLRTVRRALAWLPEGRVLPEQIWAQRHRMIVRFALIQAAGVGLFGLVRGTSVVLCALDTALVATPAVLALYTGASRRTRTISATVSLMFASATIVDLADGSDVAHFHFFVMVGVVALYQDWTAFGACILITVLHHAVLGTLEPTIVYSNGGERSDPIVWAFIHGGFLLAASATHLIAWRANEQQELSDTLTRLPNRTAFVEQLERSLIDPDLPVSVLFIDLDNFKQINDSAGHDAGDRALCYMGERLTELVRDGEGVARLGGDEFAVWCTAPPPPRTRSRPGFFVPSRSQSSCTGENCSSGPASGSLTAFSPVPAMPKISSATPIWPCIWPSQRAATGRSYIRPE